MTRTAEGRREVASQDVRLLSAAELPLTFEQRMALGRVIERAKPQPDVLALARRIRSLIEECRDPRNTKCGVLNVSELDDLEQACIKLEG